MLEVKLAILNKLLPMMNLEHSALLIKSAKELVDQADSDSSYLKMNINPFRTGLLLYHTLQKIVRHFNLSQASVSKILMSI